MVLVGGIKMEHLDFGTHFVSHINPTTINTIQEFVVVHS